jgi:alpha-tubulin suppressor-like RCC1 family protein
MGVGGAPSLRATSMRRIEIPHGRITHFVCRSTFWLAIVGDEGKVVAAGLARSGALGIGQGTNLSARPAVLTHVPAARMIACSDRTSFIATRGGTLWVCDFGVLGSAELIFRNQTKRKQTN